MANKATIREQFVSHAVELFSKHKVKQDEMFQWIRDAIAKSVESRPKQFILYNACYGGFSLSPEFERYIRDGNKVKYHKIREHASKYIQPFGKHVLDKKELIGLRGHLYAYEQSPLKKINQHLVSLFYDRPKLANLEMNISALAAYLSCPSASSDVKPTSMKPQVSYLESGDVHRWCTKYNRRDLQDVLDDALEGTYKRQLEASIAQHEEAALSIVSRDILEDFLAHYKEVQNYDVKRGQERKAFCTSILEKGYQTDMSLWKLQHIYNTGIITYIIKHNISAPAPEDAESVSHIENEFGFACASGKHANLAVSAIPEGMSWEISEYDGLEKVHIS